jgi:hypothetical protein
VPLAAHHSLEGQYNPNKQVTHKGAVHQGCLESARPLFLDVVDAAETVNWKVEMGSPNAQLLEGWKIDTLKPGDRVVVSVYPARDGSHYGFAKKLTKTAP